jgi:hypothetical protein
MGFSRSLTFEILFDIAGYNFILMAKFNECVVGDSNP